MKDYFTFSRVGVCGLVLFMTITVFFVLASLGAAEGASAKNFLPNGSFEITTVEGFPDCWDQYLGPKRVAGWYSLWKVDHHVAFHGTKSLFINVPDKNLKGKLYAESCFSEWFVKRRKWFQIRKGRTHVLSFYMKSDRKGLPVKVNFLGTHYVRVGTHWKRYHITVYFGLHQKLGRIRFTPMGVGKIWIDAVQLEEGGFPSKFAPSSHDTTVAKLPTPLPRKRIQEKLDRFRIGEGWFTSTRPYLSGKAAPIIRPLRGQIQIDPSRRCLLINGRPFFFFAACFMRAHLYKDRWPEILDMLKHQGYTAVIASFSCRWNDSHASVYEIREFLDAAQTCGLMVIPWVNPNGIKNKCGSFSEVKGRFPPNIVLREYKKEIRRMIPPLKDHPALLAWYLCDEPSKRSLIRSGFTKKIVEAARKLDNSHPLYINYGNLVEDYKFYGGTIPGDMVSRTQYPIPVSSITSVAETTGLENIAGQFKKPVVLWLQLWSGKGRYPTPDEFTCMTYLAAIYGATGFQTWPMMPGSKLLWNRVKTVISEMKELAPFLYQPKSTPVEVEGSDYIHAAAKPMGGAYWVVAVNTLDRPQTGIIHLVGVGDIRKVLVKFEGRSCEPNGSLFKDKFGPYERHVYVINTSE